MRIGLRIDIYAARNRVFHIPANMHIACKFDPPAAYTARQIQNTRHLNQPIIQRTEYRAPSDDFLANH